MAVLAAIVTASTIAASAGAAPQHAASTWYWTPGWCKNILQKRGMELADGRRFYVQRAFCLGWGGPSTCEWNSSYSSRMYRIFTSVTRSYDGTMRIFTLVPTARYNYRATKIRALGKVPNALKFYVYVRAYTRSRAKQEQAKGCATASP